MEHMGSSADLVGVGPDCEWRVSGVVWHRDYKDQDKKGSTVAAALPINKVRQPSWFTFPY